MFYLSITTTSHTGPTITLQRDSGGTAHTHATLLRGLEENLGSSLTQSAGSDHAAEADGETATLKVQNVTFPNQCLCFHLQWSPYELANMWSMVIVLIKLFR